MSKIEYDIYQIKQGEQFHGIRFEGTRFLKHAQIPIHPDHYDKIYSDKMNTDKPVTGNKAATSDVLESIYEKFNLYHPADYRGHSLSVSDVVVLHENGHTSAHLCDSFGFVEVPEFLSPVVPSPILTPPSVVGEQNYLKNAEEYLEENYNNITGMISTQNKLTPGDDTLPHPEYHEQANETANDNRQQKSEASTEKTSVLAKLKAAKEEVPVPKPKDMTDPIKDNSQELAL